MPADASSDVKFEIGHVFGRPRPNQVVPYEREHVAAVLAGDGDDVRSARALFDAVVGALRTKPRALSLESSADIPGLHPTRSARIVTTGTNVSIGTIGEIDPDVAAAWGLSASRRIGWLQFDLENLCNLPRAAATMKAFTRYPSTDIDLAFVADDSLAAFALETALRRAGGALAESVTLFDVFRGPSLGIGKRSLAYRLRLSATDRTLTDSDVATVREACIGAAEKLGASLRG